MTAPVVSPELAAAAAVSTLASQQAQAQANIAQTALQLLTRLWLTLVDPSRTDGLGGFATRAAGILRSAELATSQNTETYLRQVLGALDVQVPAHTLAAPPESLRGVPMEEVLLRPAGTVRWLRSQDTPLEAASAAGLARLRSTAETNLELAVRQTAVDVFKATPRITAYRRVLRPELSEGGACGLCIVAADRKYRTSELMPIHARCKCSVMPIIGKEDPALQLNYQDLQELYKDAGGTAGAKLKRTRYRIEQHGELGPVLVRQGTNFRTAEQAADDLKARRVRRRSEQADEMRQSLRQQLTTFEGTIPDLERRAAAGEDVAAPLAWQRARVAELREQLGSAA